LGGAIERGGNACSHDRMMRNRYRIRFRKDGDLRFISHRDLVRTLERWFRRAKLPLAMSQGFHPKPKMSFPAALAVGMIGANELMDVELEGNPFAQDVRARLIQHGLPGLSILEVEKLPPGAKSRVRSLRFEMEIPAERRGDVRARVIELLSKPSHVVARDDGSRGVDLRPAIEELLFEGDRLRMRLLVNDQGGARPRAVLSALGLDSLVEQGIPLVRTEVELTT
jgi:radical SAM-linked protein